jgi:hypothetical protein
MLSSSADGAWGKGTEVNLIGTEDVVALRGDGVGEVTGCGCLCDWSSHPKPHGGKELWQTQCRLDSDGLCEVIADGENPSEELSEP